MQKPEIIWKVLLAVVLAIFFTWLSTFDQKFIGIDMQVIFGILFVLDVIYLAFSAFRFKLHWQILIAIVLAILAGVIAGKDTTIFGYTFYSIFEFFGTLFMNALKMIIVPLVVASIIIGIAGIGSSGGIGRLGGKTILFYLTTSLFAILVGLLLVNAIEPGVIDGRPISGDFDVPVEKIAETKARVGGKEAASIADIFIQMIPTNIIAAAAQGNMLGLIFFGLLFGFFVSRITEDYAESQYNFWQGLYEIMIKMTEFIIRFSPIGVFALVAKVIAGLGNDYEKYGRIFEALTYFSFTVLAALAIHFLVTLPLLLKFIARVKPTRHYRAMSPALLTAFSTASSAATLPLTIECVEKNAGVSNRTSSFVLPLGATVNMDGTALYECVVAIFILQAFGIDLSFTTQFMIVFTALMTSIGVAAIPAASLIAIMVILKQVGLPEAQATIGLTAVLIVDRLLDMCRTSVNVFSDSCAAVIIARTEGEENVLANPAEGTAGSEIKETAKAV